MQRVLKHILNLIYSLCFIIFAVVERRQHSQRGKFKAIIEHDVVERRKPNDKSCTNPDGFVCIHSKEYWICACTTTIGFWYAGSVLLMMMIRMVNGC